MELGKGYAFVGRQVHIRTEENDYFIDLVFYNYMLRCFVLIDLKADRLSFQDVGQMDMYLHLYDTFKKQPTDNPTIGIVLCSQTNGDVVRYSSLAENPQIHHREQFPQVWQVHPQRQEKHLKHLWYLAIHREKRQRYSAKLTLLSAHRI